MRSSRVEPTVDEFARLTFLLRMVAVLLTVASLTDAGQRIPGVAIGLVLGACLSFGGLRWWRQVAPPVSRHPAIFALDVALSSLLLVLAGPGSPFFIYTLATAMLAGILYGSVGAAFFSVMLCGAYWSASVLWDSDDTFMTTVGLPSMYLVFGLGAAHVAETYRRQGRDAARLAQASSLEAATQERMRLARELHDSVTKTAMGVSLEAAALRRRITDGDEAVQRSLERLRSGAEQTAREAREVLVTLRDDSLVGPFPDVLEAVISEIEGDTGSMIERCHLDRADLRETRARLEVSRIVAEALRNAVIHGEAERVRVAVSSNDAAVEIRIEDDGRGFDATEQVRTSVANGHFGLVGMMERASQFGGATHIDSSPGQGTAVTVEVPHAVTATSSVDTAAAGSVDSWDEEVSVA